MDASADEASAQAGDEYGYCAAYLIDVTFESGQQRILEHRYSSFVSGYSNGDHIIEYILRTGGKWKGGVIGRIRVDVSFAGKIVPKYHKMNLDGWKWIASKQTMRFEASDWRPTTDLEVEWSVIPPNERTWSTRDFLDLD